AVFGAILLQKISIPVPAPAPPQATPTEGRAPGSVVTVADSAAESAVAAPVAARRMAANQSGGPKSGDHFSAVRPRIETIQMPQAQASNTDPSRHRRI